MKTLHMDASITAGLDSRGPLASHSSVNKICKSFNVCCTGGAAVQRRLRSRYQSRFYIQITITPPIFSSSKPWEKNVALPAGMFLILLMKRKEGCMHEAEGERASNVGDGQGGGRWKIDPDRHKNVFTYAMAWGISTKSVKRRGGTFVFFFLSWFVVVVFFLRLSLSPPPPHFFSTFPSFSPVTRSRPNKLKMAWL